MNGTRSAAGTRMVAPLRSCTQRIPEAEKYEIPSEKEANSLHAALASLGSGPDISTYTKEVVLGMKSHLCSNKGLFWQQTPSEIATPVLQIGVSARLLHHTSAYSDTGRQPIASCPIMNTLICMQGNSKNPAAVKMSSKFELIALA